MNRQRTILVISLLIPMGIDFQTRLTFFQLASPRVLVFTLLPLSRPPKKQSNHDRHERPIFHGISLRRQRSYGRATNRSASPTLPGCTPPMANRKVHRLGDADEVSADTFTSWCTRSVAVVAAAEESLWAHTDTAGRPLRRSTILGARGGGATDRNTRIYGAGDHGKMWKDVHHEG